MFIYFRFHKQHDIRIILSRNQAINSRIIPLQKLSIRQIFDINLFQIYISLIFQMYLRKFSPLYNDTLQEVSGKKISVRNIE